MNCDKASFTKSVSETFILLWLLGFCSFAYSECGVNLQFADSICINNFQVVKYFKGILM